MTVVFVDTGAWIATFVPNDPDHDVANAWLDSDAEPLITTDYVIDGILTLLKRRGEFARAKEIGPSLLAGSVARLEWMTPDDVRRAWEVFATFRDKDWSFTDCTSRVVMERLGPTDPSATPKKASA